MNTFAKSLLLLLTALIVSTTAIAAPIHVEVIVFANNNNEAEYEWFMKANELIKVEFFNDETNFSDTPSADEAPSPNASLTNLVATGPQPVEAYVLTEFAKAIEDNPNFELLNYVSWVQEPVPKSRTKSVSLDIALNDSFLSPDLLLSGETSIYEIAQLLQFDINVTYKPVADREEDVVYLPDAIKLYDPEVSYLLDERRQVQINDIHYFDHPKFGVVFAIIRPKQPEVFIY